MARTRRARSARPTSMNVKKGDTVLVIAGKDKGRTGKVIAANPREGTVLVEGVNRMTRHTKVGQSARGAKTGGIEVVEAPVAVSNVMIAVEVDGETVGSRVGYRIDPETQNKVRYAKRTGEDI